MSETKCELCGEPMPPGETMFKYHGYSGPCPKPALPQRRECTTHHHACDCREAERERLEKVVRDLQVEAAGLRAQLAEARDMLRLLIESVEAAEAEGLWNAILSTTDHVLKDLLTRRILYHVPDARAWLAKNGGEG